MTAGSAQAEPGGLPSKQWTLVAGSAAQTSATYTDSRAVVLYRFDPSDLPGHVLASDRGTRNANGCGFSASGSGTAAAEPQVSRIIEVAFDPKSCTRILAVATYSVSKLPARVKDSLDDNGSSSGSGTTVGPLVAAAANYSGYLKANVEDPPQLNVSSTPSSISWSASSSCVTSSTRSPYWYWLSGSGWSRTSGTILSNGSNCARAYLNVAGKFKNDAFCPGSGNTTYTNHKTLFEGKPGGGYYWSYDMTKSGGC